MVCLERLEPHPPNTHHHHYRYKDRKVVRCMKWHVNSYRVCVHTEKVKEKTSNSIQLKWNRKSHKMLTTFTHLYKYKCKTRWNHMKRGPFAFILQRGIFTKENVLFTLLFIQYFRTAFDEYLVKVSTKMMKRRARAREKERMIKSNVHFPYRCKLNSEHNDTRSLIQTHSPTVRSANYLRVFCCL